MAEMTAAQLQKIENQWLKSDCDDLALAVSHIFALIAEVRKLRCCGNCGNWEQFDEFGSEKIHNCIANKKLTWRERFDKCDKWEAADNG